jgi:hypothetical protein
VDLTELMGRTETTGVVVRGAGVRASNGTCGSGSTILPPCTNAVRGVNRGSSFDIYKTA